MSRSEQSLERLYGSGATPDEQRRAFTGGQVPVAVYGLGKMGLPLAAVYASVTGNVTGVDISESVVETINDGRSPVENEPGLEAEIDRNVSRGALSATTDVEEAAAGASIHVLIVPTLLDDQDVPDLSTLTTLTRDIGTQLDPGDVVIVESTVPPGTCADTLWPILRRTVPDPESVGLAFCPERTMSGRALQDIRGAYPKIVGGIDDESTRVAKLVYEEITTNDVHAAPDARTAECVKVFEGIYRDVNIALANELATVAPELGVDVPEAIELANTQPFCDIHRPGIGVGGHCIPVYPYFLLDSIETSAPIVRMARQINDSMPLYAIEQLREAMDGSDHPLFGANVAVLGVTYRPDVDEVRYSPAFSVVRDLNQLGANVYLVDPVCSDLSPFEGTPTSVERLHRLDLDATVLVTDHSAFDRIRWDRMDPMVVVDGRQALTLSGTGHTVRTIGDGRGVE
ncbi:nucleotide sugar dehydrogenase [Halapricum hydrolyticum]|uniref:UDP-N-acetyl-D-mannosamine dehydrogenase n=1 Tax=Halapricum hydrolyticum TaxID=2979991 RepID=A0AAE3LFF9_9EURY|nr:nucleotide sugar dehydrogenase [Halapricum hydrolyticum]MCU4718619.1 nucleotide sugar dehydrogenase [Halapricum hydrolyticum]MCU4727532.1 nucleotide sugar dehydrogenase [Halapricum hydrolyticum]